MMEEEPPAPSKQRVIAHPLGTWDVAELQAYIADLRAEITRAQAAIDKKQGHKQVADAFFRRPGEPPSN